MTQGDWTLGIVGGTGMLGAAIVRALLDRGPVPPHRLWISSRSAAGRDAAEQQGCRFTSMNQELADACDVILVSVPPSQVDSLSLKAPGRLVVSVMAGVSMDALKAATGTGRVIRAMSSPAAAQGLAYSPWCASPETSKSDHTRTTAIFMACGVTDQVKTEDHIDFFTALTGPVPGFVAFFAEAMVNSAIEKDIDPATATRAVRQLFIGASTLMMDETATPADHVRQMIDYGGTTAAGLKHLGRSSVSSEITKALDASIARAREIGGS